MAVNQCIYVCACVVPMVTKSCVLQNWQSNERAHLELQGLSVVSNASYVRR